MKRTFCCLLIVIVYNVYDPLFAQSTNSTNSIYTLKTVLDDGKSLVLKPLSWNLRDWLTFTTVSGFTIFLNQYDEQIRKDAIKDLSLYKKPVFAAAKFYGEPYIGSALALGLFAYGYYNENEKSKLIGFDIAESYLYSGLVSGALKLIVGRNRPYTDNGSHSFNPFSLTSSRNSFPSGHTTIAMALSTVLAYHIDNIYWKILIFIPPVFTGAERIIEDVHWTSDVFFGAVIGYFVSSYVLRRHSDIVNNKNNDKLLPNVDPRGRIGFTLVF